jgi:hypothetical protein
LPKQSGKALNKRAVYDSCLFEQGAEEDRLKNSRGEGAMLEKEQQ